MLKWTATALSLSFILTSCSGDRPVAAVEPVSSQAMRQFIDDYFKAYFEFNPSQATATGFHEYDGKLEDYSAAAFQARLVALRSTATHLDALRREKLTPDEAIDAAIIDGAI